jgi:hypothetical protein
MIWKLIMIVLLCLPLVWIVVHYTRFYRQAMKEGRKVESEADL